MYNLSYKRSEVAKAIVAHLTDGKLQLGLEEVFYGDEPLIKNVPAVSVIPGTVQKELQGAQYVTLNRFTVILTIFHGREGTIGLTRASADELAEAVEDFLHQNSTMSGTVVHGLVTSIDPGYVENSNVLFVGTRITWEGLSKTRIPFAR